MRMVGRMSEAVLQRRELSKRTNQIQLTVDSATMLSALMCT